MPRSSKICAAPGCGNVMHFGGKGMTTKVWAARRYCSRKCGGVCRGGVIDIDDDGNITNRAEFVFDTENTVFRFISGWFMMDIQNRIGA